MRKQVVKTLAKVGLLSVMAMFMAVASAQGQSLADGLKANIPFDFTVVDKQMPAGEYSINRAQSTAGDAILKISGVKQPATVLSLTSSTQSIDPKTVGTLVFHRYGDQYFLFQVWPKGATYGREINKSRVEREVAQKARETVGAANRMTVETVAVVVSSN